MLTGRSSTQLRRREETIHKMRWSSTEQDHIRQDIFKWLEYQEVERGGYEFQRSFLSTKYSYGGYQLSLMDRQNGIWNPKEFDSTLSITKTLKSTYADDPDGEVQRYSYERLPNKSLASGRNRKLSIAAKMGVPLILFQEIYPTLYLPRYPVYIIHDNSVEGYVTITLDQTFEPFNDPADLAALQQRYSQQLAKTRLHQKSFRTRVLHAYRARCTVCTLSHPELLDASHITPDADETSTTSVTNGLSMCKMHHAAYDRRIVGIDGDYRIHVREDIQLEKNGPMLTHGIQAMNGRRLYMPSKPAEHPDRDRLDKRFQDFTEFERSLM